MECPPRPRFACEQPLRARVVMRTVVAFGTLVAWGTVRASISAMRWMRRGVRRAFRSVSWYDAAWTWAPRLIRPRLRRRCGGYWLTCFRPRMSQLRGTGIVAPIAPVPSDMPGTTHVLTAVEAIRRAGRGAMRRRPPSIRRGDRRLLPRVPDGARLDAAEASRVAGTVHGRRMTPRRTITAGGPAPNRSTPASGNARDGSAAPHAGDGLLARRASPVRVAA